MLHSHSLQGCQVVIVHDQPRMKLAANVPVSDEFRAEIDQWMLEFFGTVSLLDDNQVIKFQNTRWGTTMYMNARCYEMFKHQLQTKEAPHA